MDKATGKIRAANFSNSERLQETLSAIASGGWITTLSIRDRTNSCAVHTDIAELRANGFCIERRYHGQINGRRVYEYRLTGGQGR